MSPRHLLVSALLFTAPIACQGSPEQGGQGAASGDGAKVEAEADPDEKKEPVTPPIEPKPAETDEGEGTETETGDEAEPAVPLPDSFEKVGVDVCDQYVTDYGKCIEKMPEAEREAARRVVFENITVWKQTASGGPAGEKSLQTACRIAREQAKRSTAALACEW